MAGRGRGLKTVGDMVRSLGLVLAAVVVLVLITFRPQGQAGHVVDYASVLTASRSGSAFALVAPGGLPATWKANSVYFDPPAGGSGAPGVTSWHVGFITPDNLYAAFEQTDGLAIGTLQDVLGDPTQDGSTTTVAGATWQRWSNSAGDRHALVRTNDGVTLVVDGSAGWPELEQLAASLRAGA